jgi:hypothetical protein
MKNKNIVVLFMGIECFSAIDRQDIKGYTRIISPMILRTRQIISDNTFRL